jgi:hypothetical protein
MGDFAVTGREPAALLTNPRQMTGRCGRPRCSPCDITPGPLACAGSTRHGLPALARLTLLEPGKMGEDRLEGTSVPRLPGQHLGPHEPVHGLRLPAQLGGTASGT